MSNIPQMEEILQLNLMVESDEIKITLYKNGDNYESKVEKL